MLDHEQVWKIYAYLARYGKQSWRDIDELSIKDGFQFFDQLSNILKEESGKNGT